MAKDTGYNYFNGFVHMLGYSHDASTLLCEICENYDLSKAEENIQKMHEFEHDADVEKHELMNHLVKEFITPIEREDIIQLCGEIDDVTDAVEDVLLRLYMFNVTEMREDAVRFCKIIAQCITALRIVLQEFSNFKKSHTLQQQIIEVNRLEEEGDSIYSKAMYKLFHEETDAVKILSWKEVYDNLEKCCDACEHVANLVEGVVMKNT